MANLLGRWWQRLRVDDEMVSAAKVETSDANALPLDVVYAGGECARCGFERGNDGVWKEEQAGRDGSGYCTLRNCEIPSIATTYCKNFASRERERQGPIYHILTGPQRACAPWVEAIAPREGAGECGICETNKERAIVIDLPDGSAAGCTPEHYQAWWADYMARRLAFFQALGEHAYSAMYEDIIGGASGHYSDAKDAFHSAITTARNLERPEQAAALDTRLEQIKSIFRHQFK